MRKLVIIEIAFVVLSVLGIVLQSSTTVKGAVFITENGIYYHWHGDCCLKERTAKNKKVFVCSQGYAEDNAYLPCAKCVK